MIFNVVVDFLYSEGVVKRERFMLILTTLLNILVDNLFDNFIKGIYTLLFACCLVNIKKN